MDTNAKQSLYKGIQASIFLLHKMALYKRGIEAKFVMFFIKKQMTTLKPSFHIEKVLKLSKSLQSPRAIANHI